MNYEEDKLKEIEVLLTQSLKGIHYLFDNETIARILNTPTENLDFFSFENMEKIQNLFTELINRQTLVDKQSFLESLDSESYEILLRTYFHIVDNTLLSTNSSKH